MKNIIKAIEDEIRKSKVIGIFSHQNADGDALGSIFVMQSILNRLGKITYLYTDTPYFPENLSFLNSQKYINKKRDIKFDLVISLDCSNLERLGEFVDLYKTCDNTINIDHHQDNTNFAKLNYVIGGASSNCEILFGMLSNFKNTLSIFPLTKRECEFMLVGILTDSARFKYSSTSANTLLVASKLLEMGRININELVTPLFDEISFEKYNVNKLAYQNTTFYEGNKLAITLITNKEYREINADYSYAKDVSQYVLAVNTIIACAIISEDDRGNFHISFRSKGDIDVSKCAMVFGGGGHVNASGCKLRGKPDDVKNKVLNALKTIL